MVHSSGSQFFRTTAGIESGPDALDKSRLVMTFLTNFGVTEKLCNFRLVLECKTEFLEKFLSDNLALSDAEVNNSGPLNKGGIPNLPSLRML